MYMVGLQRRLCGYGALLVLWLCYLTVTVMVLVWAGGTLSQGRA
jgi:hypothetical protein